MHKMTIMNREGDQTLTWGDLDTEALARANAEFDRLLGAGYLGIEVGVGGTEDRQIRQFNPAASEILMAPAIVAG